MSSDQSMDATVLMRKLVEKDINTSLLIEFYEEVVENEKIFCEMVESISKQEEMIERQKSLEHIERFCIMLRELQDQYDFLLGSEKLFATDSARRETMINNASRFIQLLESDCNIQFPKEIS
jgi:hypothetical protein